MTAPMGIRNNGGEPAPRAEGGGGASYGGVSDVLLDSRQRWRDLVKMAADLVLETDAEGRITFLDPDHALGWSAGELLGQSVGTLFPVAVEGLPDPFAELTAGRRRLWFRRRDGRLACLLFAYRPIFGRQGEFLGHRAVGIDVTAEEEARAALSARLGRALAIEHVLWHLGQETKPAAMARAGLGALAFAIGASGGAIIMLRREENGEWSPDFVRYATTEVPEELVELVLESFCRPIAQNPIELTAEEGASLIIVHCPLRFGEHAALLFWRTDPPRPFPAEEKEIVRTSLGIFRLILEQEREHEDILRQAQSDFLTGLLNRRAFFDEVGRRLNRLRREGQPATMMFIDLDAFKSINDRFGHEAGDRLLVAIAVLLRESVRPTDLIARFGGDEFAVFLDGADSYAASERAEMLCTSVRDRLKEMFQNAAVSFSVGLATFWPHRGEETIDSLLQRADAAMYVAKRAGGGHWRLSEGGRDER